MADRYQEAGYQKRLRLRDEADRLRWLEDALGKLAEGWRGEATGISGQAGGQPAPGGQARIEVLTQCATELDDCITGSRVPGGPPVDHLAWARHHLERHERKTGADGGGQ
jgi:hypothetical protein